MISGRSWRPWAPRTTRGFGNSISSTQRFVFHLTSLSIMLKWDLSCPERGVWSTLSVLYTVGGLNIWTLPWMRNCCCCSIAKSCPTLLQACGLQHARPPWPSISPAVCPSPCLLSQWCYGASHPLSSPSPPAFSLSQHQSFQTSQLFASCGQSIGFIMCKLYKC